MIEVRPPRSREAGAALDLVVARYGDGRLTAGGKEYDLTQLTCLIAVHRHTPKGALYYERDGELAVLVAIATMPRRCGTGTTMISTLANTLGRDGVTEIRTYVDPGNAAGRSFLESVGFTGSADGEEGANNRYTLRLPTN